MTVLSRFDDALAVSASGLSVSEVREQMHLVRSVQAMAAARLIELNDRLTELARQAGPFVTVDPTRELRTHGGLRAREVRALETQASATAAAPALGDLLAAGATTAAHVESVGRALDVAGEGRRSLLDQSERIVRGAATMTVDDFDRFVRRLARDAQPDEGVARFERQRRLTQLRVWNDADGMVNLAGCFDPERGSVLATTLERRVEAMFHSGDSAEPVEAMPGVEPNDHRRALALIALCAGGDHTDLSGAPAGDESVGHSADGDRGSGLSASGGRPARAEVVVHVDLATLRNGLHAAGVCRIGQGADIPPATARRLACDAEIVPVVLDGPSAPLDVGRGRRLATVHQRRALEAVHDTCAVPHCTVAYSRCSIHHVVPWEHGGPTDLSNLVPLCSRHHHAVHEGGWHIDLHPHTRRVTVTLPGEHVVRECSDHSRSSRSGHGVSAGCSGGSALGRVSGGHTTSATGASP